MQEQEAAQLHAHTQSYGQICEEFFIRKTEERVNRDVKRKHEAGLEKMGFNDAAAGSRSRSTGYHETEFPAIV